MRPIVLAQLVVLCVAAALPAQDLQAGAKAPALPIGKWLAGKPVETFLPGQVYVVEFWDVAADLGVARAKDFAALQKKHAGKLTAIGVARDGGEVGLAAVEALYAQHAADLDYRIGWDVGGKAHAAWLTASGGEAPTVFVVDGKGTLVWFGSFAWLELVLPPTLAGTADVAALAEQTDKLQKRFTRVFVAAMLKPQVAIAEMDALLTEHPFLAGFLLPGVFDTLMQEKHFEFAQRLGKRVVDLAIQNGDAEQLNGIAWSIVDPESPQQKRDLVSAERAAKRAVELTKEKDASLLDTLARVWFWKQDYAQAVVCQQKAVDLLEAGEERDQCAATLKSYQELAAKK